MATFTYTVSDIEADKMTVVFANGATADVPLFATDTQEDIEQRIANYYGPEQPSFANANDVPSYFVENQTYELEVNFSESEDLPDPGETDVAFTPGFFYPTSGLDKTVLLRRDYGSWTYKKLRISLYPTSYQLFHAFYEAYRGDSGPLDQIYLRMERVDKIVSKDLPEMDEATFFITLDEYRTQLITSYPEYADEGNFYVHPRNGVYYNG